MSLRRRGAPGGYVLTESLEALAAAATKPVEVLEIEGVAGGSLAPLRSLERLERLTLEDCSDLDFAALEGTSVRILILRGSGRLDLGALRDVALRTLLFRDVAGLEIEGTLAMSRLHELRVEQVMKGMRGDDLLTVVEHIDWPALSSLKSLRISVGGLHDLGAVGLDLTFLEALSELEELELFDVFHTGTASSPLEAPYPGLPGKLRLLKAQTHQPEADEAQLTAHLQSTNGGAETVVSLLPLPSGRR